MVVAVNLPSSSALPLDQRLLLVGVSWADRAAGM
jgi:hypothetical protein